MKRWRQHGSLDKAFVTVYLTCMNLLTVGNAKTRKGEGRGFLTFILHLAPNTLSGYNTCPMASLGCKAGCLNTAGRGIYTRTQEARIRRTKLFFEDREKFMDMLVEDILAGIRKAERMGMIPVFRLNGTSDIRWETVPVSDWNILGEVVYPNVMTMFPDIQFYDYTKIVNRVGIPTNYHLTFSRSENNQQAVNIAIIKKMNVAVVFAGALPKKWNGITVVNGDEDDCRFLDKKNVIVGLKAKGKARKDTSGFVVAA